MVTFLEINLMTLHKIPFSYALICLPRFMLMNTVKALTTVMCPQSLLKGLYQRNTIPGITPSGHLAL